MASATFKYFENKGIPKPWMKLCTVTTFDTNGFYVRDWNVVQGAKRETITSVFKSNL